MLAKITIYSLLYLSHKVVMTGQEKDDYLAHTNHVLFDMDLPMKYTVQVVRLCSYIVWFVIAAPIVRSVSVPLHTVTLLMMIQNTQWIRSSRYSLNVFPIIVVSYPPGGILVNVNILHM